MQCKMVEILLLISCIIFQSRAIGIDDKLDFGSTRTHPSFKSSSKGQNRVLPLGIIKTKTSLENSDNFDNIGVVCVSSGCSNAKSTSNSDDATKADIELYIEAKVGVNLNKTQPLLNTSDIPVIVGYSGSKLDSTIPNVSEILSAYGPYASTNPVSKIPNYESVYNVNRATYYTPYKNNRPLSGSVAHVNTAMVAFKSSNNPNTPSYYPYSNSYHYVSDLSTPVHSNTNPLTRNYNPSIQSDSFNAAPRADMHIKTFLPIALSVSGNNHINKAAIDLNLPNYNPSHHYYEKYQPPQPQYAWYPKKSNKFNPVEFTTVKSTWTLPVWHKEAASHRHTATPAGHEVNCHCQSGHGSPGLQWYPDSTNRAAGVDPGSQINDKLAPLD